MFRQILEKSDLHSTKIGAREILKDSKFNKGGSIRVPKLKEGPLSFANIANVMSLS